MRSLTLGVLLALVTAAIPAGALTTSSSGAAAAPTAVVAKEPARAAVPRLVVTKRVTGLSNPWDVKPIGGGRLLITERDTARLFVAGKGAKRRVAFPSDSVWVNGETGLMSLEVDPGFPQNRRFYTCSGGFLAGGGHDVRVNAWTLNKALTRATLVKKLVGGFPTTTGRHGGCRLLISSNGALVVGTGDAAVGTNPRDLDSLGGKMLRLNRTTGAPWPSNPFIDAQNKKRRYVLTYGHRNIQGLAQRRDGTLWSVEHGSYRDDEVNRIVTGGDYGWNPVPGYDESVPMTDQSLPGTQLEARWRSGDPTIATSGASFVYGKKWGALDGALAVAALKATRVVFLTFDAQGKLVRKDVPKILEKFGRLRSVTRAPNGDLLITTDTDSGGGSVLRVRPAG
ncbi:glucose dehydrogenase [Nocardioides psychrotolerans]|uniref:Glucose/arabinose dehydrogenase, beta-propeller fold n=1 Tax=Nocardioides psychrotolerans TaxID=1005945 RepID=A0A1I3P0V2_9ACTN|nr:PQQ-dependent sugar dehydrogenase [Nocardioides psychrotolerans]GEP39564.1 glucose dehydrogenase [Nocardioides psychrotolerans]SFJ15017.1 Glucose/arabinose dehydrogenase, beta-propeller fold [Nocardioides psychrotolerans]